MDSTHGRSAHQTRIGAWVASKPAGGITSAGTRGTRAHWMTVAPGCAQGVTGNGRVLIDRLVASAFGQTGHWSRHGPTTGFDPKRTLALGEATDFRTIQPRPKDLSGSPRQADSAVD